MPEEKSDKSTRAAKLELLIETAQKKGVEEAMKLREQMLRDSQAQPGRPKTED